MVYLPGLSCTEKPLHKVRSNDQIVSGEALNESDLSSCCNAKDVGGSWDPLWKPSLPHNVFINSLSYVQTKLGWISPDMASSQCPPNWIYFTWALGLFAYQSMDAIDGKQARRTGTSGPLGEMFDHGCVRYSFSSARVSCYLQLTLSFRTLYVMSGNSRSSAARSPLPNPLHRSTRL